MLKEESTLVHLPLLFMGKVSFGSEGTAPLIPPQNISNIFLNQADIGTADINKYSR